MSDIYDDEEYEEQDSNALNSKKILVITGVVIVILYSIFMFFNNRQNDDQPQPAPSQTSSPQDRVATNNGPVAPTAKPSDGLNEQGSPVDGMEGDAGDVSNVKYPISQKEMNNAAVAATEFVRLASTYKADDPDANTKEASNFLANDSKANLNQFYPTGQSFETAKKEHLVFEPVKIEIGDVSYVSTNEIGLSVNSTVKTYKNGKESSTDDIKYSIVMQKKSSGTWGVSSISDAADPIVGSD